MKLKSLLALAAVALCGTANAQITDGTYYLRNVEAGKYVAWGAAWGTRSVLTEHGAAANITVNNGAYTIKLGCKNTNTALRPSDGFADQSGTWEIAPVGDGTYTIKGSNGYYRYDGSALPAVNGAETDNGIYWEILSPAELTAKMSAATVDNPVDATHFIKSPDFLGQDANITSGSAWNGIKNWNGNSQPKFTGDTGQGNTLINNTNAEAWNMESVDINQTLTGLPKGTYTLSVYGFYRAGGFADAASLHANGEEELKAILYAGEATVPLMSIIEGAGKNGNVGANTSAGYVPNSNIDAAKYFAAGYYLNTLIFSVDESGEVQIGMKKDSKYEGDWVVIDNFGLKYYGDVAIAEVELAEYVNAYNEAMDAAKALLDADMADDAKTALNTAITSNTVDLNNATEELLTEATNNLKEATKVAQAAADKKAWENKRDELIAEGKGTDLTELLVNAAFEMGNLTGWTSVDGGNIANNTNYNTSKFVERWLNGVALGNGSLTHDAINLPAGLYTIKVDAQNLEQYNGNAAGKGLFLRAAGEEVEIGARGIYSMLVKLDEAQDVTIAIVQDNCTGNWVCYDNIQLIYEGEDLPALTAVTGNMNAEVASAQTNALAAYNANKTVANYNAAAAAISAAEDSKAKYDAVSAKVSTLDDAGKAAFAETATGAKYAANTYVDEDITADYITAVKAQGVGADMTAAAPTSWDGQSGLVAAQYCPDMPGAPERYQAGAFTGDVMTMTITGLKEGTYKVVLRGGASYTSGRGFDGGTGQNRAYLFANDALYSLEVYDRTVITEGTVETAELTCGVNEDGTLKMGIQNKTMGANWFVVKLESITYMSESLPTTDVELAVSEAQYATFMAPFDAELPAGVVAYTVDGIGENNELVMTETTIKANTPVVLFSESPVTETLKGVSLAEAATYTVGLLTGVYAPVEITAGYVLQNGEKGVKFYAVSADDAITVPANKAYLTTTSEAKALNFPAVATAINALTTGGVEAIYNANGVKQSKLQKGMNIIMVNGQAQKVLVK